MAHGPPPGHASFGDAGNRPAAQTATEAEGYAGVASSTPDVLVRAAPHVVQELLRTFVALGRGTENVSSAPDLTTTADSFRLLFDVPESAAGTLSPLRVHVVSRLAAALDWFCEIAPRTDPGQRGTRLTLRGPRAVASSSPSVAPPSK